MAITLKMAKPKPRFSTIEECRKYIFSISLHSHNKERLIDPNDYPCMRCGGNGKIRKMEDRCPVEGFKGAPWHKCEFCGGTGKVDPCYYQPIIDQELQDFEANLQVYSDLLSRFNSILCKVEPEDVEFLFKNVNIVPDPK